MRDRKELIKILECCHEDDCWHCPAYCTSDRSCDGATELSIPVPVFVFEDVQKLLKEQEAIIRCKDCKHFLADKTCGNPRLCDQEDISTSGPDWFCADGERRET